MEAALVTESRPKVLGNVVYWFGESIVGQASIYEGEEMKMREVSYQRVRESLELLNRPCLPYLAHADRIVFYPVGGGQQELLSNEKVIKTMKSEGCEGTSGVTKIVAVVNGARKVIDHERTPGRLTRGFLGHLKRAAQNPESFVFEGVVNHYGPEGAREFLRFHSERLDTNLFGSTLQLINENGQTIDEFSVAA